MYSVEILNFGFVYELIRAPAILTSGVGIALMFGVNGCYRNLAGRKQRDESIFLRYFIYN